MFPDMALMCMLQSRHLSLKPFPVGEVVHRRSRRNNMSRSASIEPCIVHCSRTDSRGCSLDCCRNRRQSLVQDSRHRFDNPQMGLDRCCLERNFPQCRKVYHKEHGRLWFRQKQVVEGRYLRHYNNMIRCWFDSRTTSQICSLHKTHCTNRLNRCSWS